MITSSETTLLSLGLSSVLLEAAVQLVMEIGRALRNMSIEGCRSSPSAGDRQRHGAAHSGQRPQKTF
jgi:hypothetical protein